MNTLEKFEKEYLKTEENTPKFEVGDMVKVHHLIVEGGKQRTQVFQGIIISMKGKSLSKMFTVRRISFGVGVEKTFPLHSPRVEKVEIVRHSKIRRAKLYYMRELSGKSARLKERMGARKAKAE